MNISLKDCRNTQVGENNEMIVGGERYWYLQQTHTRRIIFNIICERTMIESKYKKKH